EVSHGRAVPHIITRHTHPKARPETPEPPPPATGIDYLALTAATHHEQIRADRRIGYNALFTTGPAQTGDAQVPGQLSIDDLNGHDGHDGVSA
ncbi:MAG: transposase, partial [Mycobacterium sp.]